MFNCFCTRIHMRANNRLGDKSNISGGRSLTSLVGSSPVTRLLLLCLLIAGCSRPPAPLVSPSGAFSARAEISGNEAGPTRRLCVRLRVTDIPAKREITFQTGASDVQKWAVGWSPSNSLVLYSSDVGTMAYDIKNGQIAERMPDATEQEVARKAYEQKYGTKPRD